MFRLSSGIWQGQASFCKHLSDLLDLLMISVHFYYGPPSRCLPARYVPLSAAADMQGGDDCNEALH